jgi:hypothetical protein
MISQDKNEGCLPAALLFILGVPATMALYAEAVMLNWAWFVVPLGVPRVGFAHAYGLCIIGALVAATGTGSTSKKPEGTALNIIIRALGTGLGRSGLAILMGWALHAWMISP